MDANTERKIYKKLELKLRTEVLIKELEEEFHSPEGGFILIMDNGESFGHIVLNGSIKVIMNGLRQAMFDDPSFRYAVYQTTESVMNELDEDF